MARCKFCGAPILWILMASTGKPMPVEAEKKGVVVTANQAMEDGRIVTGFIPHWSSCSHKSKGEKNGGKKNAEE